MILAFDLYARICDVQYSVASACGTLSGHWGAVCICMSSDLRTRIAVDAAPFDWVEWRFLSACCMLKQMPSSLSDSLCLQQP